jgi:hypothetical protein
MPWQGDVRMIAIGPPSHIAFRKDLRRHFPQMTLVPAVDARLHTPEEALMAGDLAPAGYNSIRFGRAQHCQLPTMGALGLYLSWRRALEGAGPLLLFEEDCGCSDGIHKALEEFVAAGVDVGIIGSICGGGRPVPGTGWVMGPSIAFQTHCVVFSPVGRARVLEHVTRHAADIQVDCLLVTLGNAGAIKLGVFRHRVAWQEGYGSTIQLPMVAQMREPPDVIVRTNSSDATCPPCAVSRAAIAAVAIVLLACVALTWFPLRRSRITGSVPT